MKRPEQIDFETYDEFEEKMEIYKEHKIHEEWAEMRNYRKTVACVFLIVVIGLVGCLVLC